MTDHRLDEDLQALRRDSARNVTSLESIVRTAKRRPRTWEEVLMTPIGSMSRRPWTTAALAGAFAVLALLVVPISYEKITGQSVALTFSAGQLDGERVAGIAHQLKHQLHSNGVSVQAEAKNGGMTFTLTATVPNSAHISAGAAAKAFEAELKRLGYNATSVITPIKERVTGSVYAFARDRIEVSLDNKTAAQIESEIRQGLADAGVTNAQVTVTESTEEGKKALKLAVEAQKTSSDGQPPSQPMPELVLTKGGLPVEGQGFTIRAEKSRGPDGTSLTLHVQQNGKKADIVIPHVDTLSDDAIKAQVESQLSAAGIDAKVTVTNGHVMVEKE